MNDRRRKQSRIWRNPLLMLALSGHMLSFRGANGFSNSISSYQQTTSLPRCLPLVPTSLRQPREQFFPSTTNSNLVRNLFKADTDEVSAGASKITDAAETEFVTDQKIYQNAIRNTVLWIAAASCFGAGLWFGVSPTTGEEFFAGYLVEQSLSVDNLFVFLLLFEYFKVPLQYQNRVLKWGIFGAVVMRATMISFGAVAIQNFQEVLLVFAAVLLFSSGTILVEMSAEEDDEEDLSNNSIVLFSRKLINASPYFDEDRFFTVVDGVKQATPLLLCLVAVEISDVVFAVDSIPAVFGVTEDPLIVFSSNIFAILSLRSIYTVLSKAATDLKYLEPAVAVVLGFIGCKMIGQYFGYDIPTSDALAIVASLLGVGVGASLWERKQEALKEP